MIYSYVLLIKYDLFYIYSCNVQMIDLIQIIFIIY